MSGDLDSYRTGRTSPAIKRGSHRPPSHYFLMRPGSGWIILEI